jgi:long-chain acyl-CoA synthetase
METLTQLLLNTVKSYPKDCFIQYKKEGTYTPISTQEFFNRLKWIALGLNKIGVKTGDKVIILSENRPEWVMTDFAVLSQNAVTVPIYPTLSPPQIEHIINDSDAQVVIVADEVLISKILPIRDKISRVRHLISFESVPDQDVLSLFSLMEKGKLLDQEEPDLFEKKMSQVKPDDLASIIYTSGTTGVPKGVMLTHANFVSNITSLRSVVPFLKTDDILSFLPLSHVLERMCMFAFISQGCSIHFAESIETVADNLVEIKPTIMVSVPRLFEKIYVRVIDNVLSGPFLKRKIFFWAVRTGKKASRRKQDGHPLSKWLNWKVRIAEKLVFSKILERTGKRIRYFVSGGAPLSRDIAEFFHAVGLIILEGYGLTETSPVVTCNTLNEFKFGSVGKPIPEVYIKFAEDGEILVKGPNVMQGYYKMDEETQAVFSDGWLKTGDIGYKDKDGFVFITDRKKDLIVTAGGKNIAPQMIESRLKNNPYLSQVVVVGARRKFISALVVPNFEKLELYARKNDISFSSHGDLVNKKEIIDFLMEEINRLTNDLSPFERVKKIAVLDRELEESKGEVTPTLKIKRHVIERKYQDLIDALYQE